MMNLRAISADDWMQFRELRREALREAPYAFGSTLAEWSNDGDSEIRWRARLDAVPFNVIAELDGRPAGLAGGTHTDDTGEVELISLWVAPFARGRGISDALIERVVGWARERRARSVALSVRPGNAHAIALYQRHRFVPVEGRTRFDVVEIQMRRSLADEMRVTDLTPT